MVFLGIRILYGLARQFAIILIRVIFMFCGESFFGCHKVLEAEKKTGNASLFAILASHGNRDDVRFRASFTVEATLALGIVFISLASLIQYAYTVRDKVTGSMILEEMLIRARRSQEEKYSESYFEETGNQLGNPRLWLGEYEIDLSMERNKVSGKASAGEWEKEIEMGVFRPSTYLRQNEFLGELLKGGEENDDREDRIQEGNESELYGDTVGNGTG